MQVIENWAEARGRVIKVAPHPTLGDYVVVEMEVDAVSPVADYPNLIQWAEGQTLRVNLPAEKARELSLAPGMEISFWVRRGSPDSVFADPQRISVL